MTEILDITVIGGGPSGLYSAFYAGLRGMSVRIIEHHDTLGGKVNLFPEKIVWDVGGYAATPASVIREGMVKQGMTFNPEVHLGEKVVNIKKLNERYFEVETTKHIYYSKAVIVAVGSGIINPTKLEIDGAARYEVTNLHYVVPSIQHFKCKRVVISGGGNAALDWALDIAPFAQEVTILCRKDEFKGHEQSVNKLDELGVKKLINHKISSLQATDEHIYAVEIENTITCERDSLLVDDVIVNHGFDMDSALLDNSDVKFERVDNYYVRGNADSSTDTPGVYVVGDLLTHESKVKLIAGCYHDAANAINHIKTYIDPSAAATGIVSSHNHIFDDLNKEVIQSLVKESIGCNGNVPNCASAEAKLS